MVVPYARSGSATGILFICALTVTIDSLMKIGLVNDVSTSHLKPNLNFGVTVWAEALPYI